LVLSTVGVWLVLLNVLVVFLTVLNSWVVAKNRSEKYCLPS
jgi:NADH:ubiquinone oxidoreductase subunit 4 (subunit M)